MKDLNPYPDSIVSELNSDNRENLADFIEYVYSVFRSNADEYEALILQTYHFDNDYYNTALQWIQNVLSQHMFSQYFIDYCIQNALIDSAIHYQWKYVQGLGGGIPIDSTVVILEGDEQLLIWLEYKDTGDHQPLAPFAELNYYEFEFYLAHRCDRFLIYSLFGHDAIRDRNINIELRVYNEKCHDEDGDMYFSDHQSLAVADEFLGLIYRKQRSQKAELLTSDEIDALLMSDSD